MRQLLLLSFVSAACAASSGCATNGGDDMKGMDPDACPMPMTQADTGPLAASKAQMCNVPGSMGKSHWYKLAAQLPDTIDYVQVELWDQHGVFAGGTVHPGMFTIAGAEADPTTCGVCVRGVGAKDATDQKAYFATSGTVNVTAVGGSGQPFSATLSNISFVEIDSTATSLVASGCTAALDAAQITGTVVQMGGTGGGGGGGGGSGGGCALTVGD
ncbi:MAG TPA: hypothetical protein VHN14_35635 [Kofleriaceae bacterium]|jgi:hypothetical protein|nr:hypothetical protein [Kofleriaceae bacterium]